MTVQPGSTIGIIGGGQLGRMLGVAAAQLGYKCHIFDPHERPCAADVAAEFTRAAYDDREALEVFGKSVDIATYEFENLPVGPLRTLGDKLRPGVTSLSVAQDRAVEKQFIENCGAKVAPWRSVESIADVKNAIDELGTPIVLKTRRYGYDGKGQAWIRSPGQAEAAWDAIAQEPAVAEAGVDFDVEFSVIVARWIDGRKTFWDSPHNLHRDGILRTSTVPGGELIASQVDEARKAAEAIADTLAHVGVLTVEFFASADGPVVNEIAPRVHNSGHWTIEGAFTSQFEQHIRAICDLPPGSTELAASSATMNNLIGHEIGSWPDLLADPLAHVHIYGKGEARPGRKMGHVTRLVLK
jgi:5-(carboxyamino)imidazole ribonucleotide synthase